MCILSSFNQITDSSISYSSYVDVLTLYILSYIIIDSKTCFYISYFLQLTPAVELSTISLSPF